MLQIGLRFLQGTLFDFHIGLGLVKIGQSLIEVRLGRALFCYQRLGAVGIKPCQFQCSLRAGEITFRLRDCRLKCRWINLRHRVSRFHVRVKATNSFWILPETWLPTCTFTTGLSVPVAVTACVIGPRVTIVVWNSPGREFPQRSTARVTMTSSAAATRIALRLFIRLSVRPACASL